IYALMEFVKSNRIADFAKRTGIILFVVAVAVGCNTTNLWTNSEYVKETMRGGNSELTKTSAPGLAEKKSTGLDINYAFSWSYGIIESMNMIIPNLMGGGSNQELLTADSEIGKKYGQDEYIQLPTYWGDQPFTSGPTYIGGLIFIFFIFFMLVEQNKIKWFFLATVVLSLMLAWGRHFLILNEFLFNHLPIYNKFRTPSMALTIATISLYFTGGWFFSKLVNGEYTKELLSEKFKTLAYIIGGFALFAFYLGVSGLDFKSATADARILEQNKDFPIADLIADRKMLMMNDTYRFMLLMAVSLGLIWAYVTEKMKNAQYFMAGLSLIMVVDIWSVGKRYVNTKDYSEATSYEEFIPSTPADMSILNDKSGQFRVFNSTNDPFNDNSPGFFHSNVGGYSAAKLYRYQDIIERHLSRGNMAVFNMLNTKYFITPAPGQGTTPQAQQNPGACGNAWFVREIKFAKNADEEISLMDNFDPKNTVIIDERYKADVKNVSVDSLSASMNSIVLAKYHPDKMEYTSNVSGEQFAVFSEIWYRGNEDWKAYIDGKEAKMTRVNYLLRGMNIPAGKHEVVFEFKPDCYYKGNIYGYASSIIFYLMCIGILFSESKRKED
ncbi:MAG: YfhO family protein, partial [Chitinophagales bacterium]|nr:YfhO family protein [Chitinophagales bacterium]